MIEFFQFAGQYGIPGTLTIFFFYLVYTGRMVPKARVDELREEIKELKETVNLYRERGDVIYSKGLQVAQSASQITTQFATHLPGLEADVQAATAQDSEVPNESV